MATTPAVSIIVPTYCEALRLPTTLRALLDGLGEHLDGVWEIVVSDDGSIDDTAGVADDFARLDDHVRVVRSATNRGKGAAIVTGWAVARGDRVVLLDADLPVSLATIGALVAAADGAALVLGTRRGRSATDDGGRGRAQPLGRWVGGRVFLALLRLLGLRVASDPQCGIKVLRRHELDPIVTACLSERFAFDVELIRRTLDAGCSVTEVPVVWRHVPGSSVHPIRDGVRTALDLAALRRVVRSVD